MPVSSRQPAQLLGRPAARYHDGPVFQGDREAAIVVGAQMLDLVLVDDVRAVHLAEPASVETGRELSEGPVQEENPLRGVDPGIVVLGLDPANALDVDRNDAIAVAGEEARQEAAGKPNGAKRPAREELSAPVASPGSGPGPSRPFGRSGDRGTGRPAGSPGRPFRGAAASGPTGPGGAAS